MSCNALFAALLLSACVRGEKGAGRETGISATDDTGGVTADDTADTGDSAPCEGSPDTGRLNTCEDMDAAAPEDDPDLCDQLLPCVRSVKRCGVVEDQWAGWDLASGMVGEPQLPVAVGDNGYEGWIATYLLEDVTTSGWLTEGVTIGAEDTAEIDGFGYSVATGADLDGDGLPDLAVGTPFSSVTTTRHGAVLLYSGPVEEGRTPEDADGRIRGLYYDDYFGEALAPVPDVNDDGYDELLTGVYAADWDGTPSARLFLGPVADDTTTDDAATTWYNDGTSPGDDTLAVDLTGDGGSELVISDAFKGDLSAVWVLDSEDRGVINLADGASGVFGTADERIVAWHLGAGDMTQDGYNDLVFQMDYPTSGDRILNWGVIIAGPMTQSLSVTEAIAQYRQLSDGNWPTVPAVAGDLDGDGISGDLLVGTTATSGVHLLPAPLCGTYELDRHTLLTQGSSPDGFHNMTIVPLPDIDGDGYDDALIGAPFDDEGAPDAGAVYTLFGGSW